MVCRMTYLTLYFTKILRELNVSINLTIIGVSEALKIHIRVHMITKELE